MPVWDTFQYVPLLETLIQDPDIREEIEGFRLRMNGTNYKKISVIEKWHPLLSTDPFALQIIAYFDELEVSNHLG